MHISLLIEDDKWFSLLGTDLEALAQRVCGLAVLRAPVLEAFLPGEREELGQSVVLTNNASIRELNRQFRTKDKPTNVLSFPAYDDMGALRGALAAPSGDPMLEDAGYLGDMILAREIIEEEAKEQQKSVKDHFCHLLVHGTLHLLGYDHIEQEDAEEMETLEIHILRELSIANPYE